MKDLAQKVIESIPEDVTVIFLKKNIIYNDGAFGNKIIPGIRLWYLNSKLEEKELCFKAQSFLEYMLGIEGVAKKRVEKAMEEIKKYLDAKFVKYEIYC